MRAAGKEQNPLVANGRRDLMRDMGRHMPPRLGCVRNATQVQGSRRNLNLVYKQVNENNLPKPNATPHPQEGQVCAADGRSDARLASSWR
jgi:hypothetical protein